MEYHHSTLLITGGTGSFGNKMVRYFLKNTDIKEIRVFSRDEEKQDRMRTELKDDRVKYFIGDIRNYDSIDYALKGVDYIFHAAALKQVPSCEFWPMEAVRTNIIGADNVMTAAIKNHVKNIVVLSTDKAVAPINAMGMTKAMMEKLMVSKARCTNPNDTVLCATRYGNVMASRGSVIPLFIKQCKAGKSLTITNPDMTRFLMSLEESVRLVLFAFNHAQSGDIFVQKAPAATILDLAEAVREIFNPKVDIQIIGTRHGEKAHETLVGFEEMQKAIDMEGFFRIPMDSRDLNYEKYMREGTKTSDKKEYTSFNTERLDKQGVINRLLSLDYVQQELKQVV